MRGAYINGGWMIISESTVGVDAFDYEAPEAEHDWVIFCGGDHLGDKRTLKEAKMFANAWAGDPNTLFAALKEDYF